MEFTNRIDDIILFEHLSKNDMIKILDNQIISLNKIVKNKNILINLNNEAKDWIIRECYDYEYGARPLNRAIKKYINDPLAKMIISKKIIDGNINISVENEKLNFGL